MENNNMKYINDEKITNLVIAMMCYIKDEWERCYWNAHQKQEDSPFVSGAYLSYKNNYVTIKRYDYGADEETPNLIVPGMQVIWYKHFKRGVDVYIDKDIEIRYSNQSRQTRKWTHSIKRRSSYAKT